MENKQCHKCKEIKSISNFRKNKSYKNGIYSLCKDCERNYRFDYKNKIKKKNIIKEFKKCNKCDELKPIINFYKNYIYPDGYRSFCKICISKKSQSYYKNNIKQIRNKVVNWQLENYGLVKKYIKKYKDKKRNSDISFKINNSISSSINNSLKNNRMGNHWEKLVGYTLNNLINHLEKKFKQGMSWNNYGLRGWHIDHIIPISLWKFEKPENREFKQCWALANLQPLWAKENIRKRNKIDI